MVSIVVWPDGNTPRVGIGWGGGGGHSGTERLPTVKWPR